MIGCLYLSTSMAKAALSPCLTSNIRAASGSRSVDIVANLANTGPRTRLEEISPGAERRLSERAYRQGLRDPCNKYSDRAIALSPLNGSPSSAQKGFPPTHVDGY